MNTRAGRIVLCSVMTAGFALGLILGLGMDAPPARAQVDRPGVITEEIQRLYGTRQMLPFTAAAGAGDAASASLRVTNLGWSATHLLVVEMATVDPACDTGFDAERILAVHCRSELARMASVEVPLSGQDGYAMVYSLDPERADDACAAFAPVQRGETTLAEWEAGVLRRAAGEPLAVLGEARLEDGRAAAMPAEASLALESEVAGRISASLALARIDRGGTPARLRLANTATTCARVETRVGPDSSSADCRPVDRANVELAANTAADLAAVTGPDGTAALSVERIARPPAEMLQLTAAIDQRDDELWLRHAASRLSTPDSRILSFPLALSPLPDSRTELWVTNAHVTATVQVNLAMSDGNGQVLRNFNDPVGLCPGATRVYDILDLAGEIPPSGRGGNGAPYLSLRVEGLAAELGEFAPIAGSLILRSPEGSFAYPGLNLPFEAAALRPRRDQLGGDHAVAAVLPGLKLRHGPQQMTSFVAIAGLGSAAGDNQVTIDFYDAEGNLVVEGFQRPLQPVGFFGLEQVALRDGGAGQRLPDGFIGTAVIRGQRNPAAALGAVAIERPAQSDRQSAATGPIHAYTSQILRLWPDPDAPTPTPPPTRPQPSPTPEISATPEEPTPTPRDEPEGLIHLPLLLRGWDLSTE